MADITYAEIVKLTEQLSPAERAALARHLQADAAPRDTRITREEILAEHQQLVGAGAFKNLESMADKYARPGQPDLDFDTLEAGIREFSNEWEKELDELFGED